MAPTMLTMTATHHRHFLSSLIHDELTLPSPRPRAAQKPLPSTSQNQHPPPTRTQNKRGPFPEQLCTCSPEDPFRTSGDQKWASATELQETASRAARTTAITCLLAWSAGVVGSSAHDLKLSTPALSRGSTIEHRKPTQSSEPITDSITKQ